MAACHYCGAEGASERREVETSRSNYYGSRSSSTRVSYSRRAVCASCARQQDIDYWRQEIGKERLSVVVLGMLAGLLLFFIFNR